jgi:Rho termination factor, N-terminal domain
MRDLGRALERKSRSQLIALAEELGVAGASRMRKDQVLALLASEEHAKTVSRRLGRRIRIWGALGTAVAVSGLVIGFRGAGTSIDPLMNSPAENPTKPALDRFVLRNGMHLPIGHLTFSCAALRVSFGEGNAITGPGDLVTGRPPITLWPSGTTTTRCPLTMGGSAAGDAISIGPGAGSLQDALIELRASYRIGWLIPWSARQRYQSAHDQAGGFYWEPVAE